MATIHIKDIKEIDEQVTFTIDVDGFISRGTVLTIFLNGAYKIYVQSGMTPEDAKEAAIVEVNSETDFVAKNDTFRTYVAEVADQALTTKAADIEGFLAEESKAEAGKTVKEALDGKIAVIGENLNIRRFAKVSAADGFVASYIHAGGKIGVLVEVATDVVNDEIKEMAKNVEMQVAAISPKYTRKTWKK